MASLLASSAGPAGTLRPAARTLQAAPPALRLRATPFSSRVALTSAAARIPQAVTRWFSGSDSPFLFGLEFSSITQDIAGFGQAACRTFRGIKIYAMRHGKRIARLNRPPDQRKALLRGLTTELLKHGRIKTTLPRAKAVRRYVDRMITLAKDGSLHKRRQALAFIYDKLVVHCMFKEAPRRYAERNGGYTRIMRTFNRRGDNAPMAYIELVEWYEFCYFYFLLFGARTCLVSDIDVCLEERFG